MAEARKSFPTSVFAAYLKGENAEAQKSNINELLAYMTQKDAIDEEFRPFAMAISKAYVYEQHPELAKMGSADVADLGSSVSVTPLPGTAKTEADAVFAKLADYSKTIADQDAKIKDLESKLAAAESKLAETNKSMNDFKGKYEALEASSSGAGEEMIVAPKAKVEEYIGKVDELLKMIEDVKKHGVVTVASGAAPAGGDAPAGPSDSPGEVSDTFGFGSDDSGEFGF